MNFIDNRESSTVQLVRHILLVGLRTNILTVKQSNKITKSSNNSPDKTQNEAIIVVLFTGSTQTKSQRETIRPWTHLGQGRNVVGVVVEILMSFEELLLPEALVAEIALEWLLVGVDEHVGLKVPLADRGVGAEVALEALFALVGLLVHLRGNNRV